MGRYTSSGDMRKLFKAFDTVKNINDTDLEFFVTMSEAEIDGYLAQQYTLPFSNTPPLVRSIASEYATIKALDTSGDVEKDDSSEFSKESGSIFCILDLDILLLFFLFKVFS